MATRSRDVLDDAEVVADEQIGEVERLAQLHEQVEDLRLDRDVERGDRLVADQEIGLHRQRAGDADALALAAGELVRIAAAQGRVEADWLQHVRRRSRRARGGDDAVDLRRLADDRRRRACAD